MLANLLKKYKETSCSCQACKDACKYKPGWFLPGEAQKAADHLGISLEEFFKRYVGIDYFVRKERDIFVLAPATKRMKPGEVYPFDPVGECCFFKDGKCQIYEVRPFECKTYIHSEDDYEASQRHKKVAKAWENNQAEVEELYGK